MAVEIQPNETFENYSHRVAIYEQGRALMLLAQGHDPETVLDETSRRIVNKLQHPVMQAIHKSVLDSAPPYSTLEDYRRDYINRVGVRADHIRD